MSAPAVETVWCNLTLSPENQARLRAGIGGRRLVFADLPVPGNLPLGREDPSLAAADIVYGQPDAKQAAGLAQLRFIQASSAGVAAFEAPAVRDALVAHGTVLTNSSSVFADPCAEHVLALMLAHVRRLSIAFGNQLGPRGWPKVAMRTGARLLRGETVVIVGMGTIGRRLAQLLAPFGCDIIGVRRRLRADDPVGTVDLAKLDGVLSRAAFVVDLLPGGADTIRFFTAARFAAMKPGAVFLNIGRGTSVDQDALAAALVSGALGAAYLDVTDPEPLPPEHPLWADPRCVITPHSAGGHADEPDRLVAHFLANLARWERGEPVVDRII